MLVNQRIKALRVYRRLSSQELAGAAGLTPGAVSLLESKLRTPRIDTLQRLAAALEVSSSYLLGEEDAELPTKDALSKQTFRKFCAADGPDESELVVLRRILGLSSAPDTIKGWRDLRSNLRIQREQLAPTRS